MQQKPSSPTWYVYILQCNDNSLYTGVTTDPARRIQEHNSGTKGARYTRSRRPLSLVYCEICKDRSDAYRKEYTIKSLPRKDKLELLRNYKYHK